MSEPTLRLLSLGAGVQSTTLALMAAHGDLPGLDGAIFADTGWEPRAVYEHLDRLEPVLTDAGIPLYRVSAGNLRSDTIDPDHRYASIPYYVKGPCQFCEATGQVTSLGFGIDGAHLPEADQVRRWLGIEPNVPAAHWPLYTGNCPRCKGTGEQLGISRRQCTGEYKVKPIRSKIRELLGYPHPKPVPRGVYVEQWIGFSTDEMGRVDGDKNQPNYARARYPLLELGMDRKACDRWLRAHGWTSVAKSACIGCPFHGNRMWRELRDNRPEEWADAVEFDRQIRRGGIRAERLRGEAFLHASRVPLDQAPIDKVTRGEWKDRQGDIFDQLEDGDPDGCSPYGCRSGLPVEVTP